MPKQKAPNPNLKEDRHLETWYRLGLKLKDHDRKEGRLARGPHPGMAGLSRNWRRRTPTFEFHDGDNSGYIATID